MREKKGGYIMRKAIALLLLLALTVGLAAGCSPGPNENPPQGSSTTQSSTTAQPDPAQPEKVVLLIREEWEIGTPGEEDVLKYVTEQTGIDVKYIKPPAGTYEETLSIMLAGGDQLDAFIAFGTWTDLAQKGYIAPLSDLLHTYGTNILATQPESDFAPLTDQKTGQIMALPFTNTRLGNAPRVRTDWLSALGLSVPTDLDSFEAMLKAFKETDKFGNNVIPLITSFQFNQLDRAFAGMWIETGDNRFIDGDGRVKECVFAPGYKDYIAKMAEWYAAGYIWPESFIQEFTVINDIVAQGRVGAMATWVSVGLSGYDTLHTIDPGAEYKYVEKLGGPKGSAYSLRPAASQGIVVSAKSEKPETVIRLFDWLAIPDNTVVTYSGIEGVHWNWVDKGQRIIEKSAAGEQFKGLDLLYGGYDQGTYDDTFTSSLWRQYDEFNTNSSLVLKEGDDNGIVYDEEAIAGAVSSLPDIVNYRESETVKFIMGQRKMSEWDSFITELLEMGYDKVIDARTEQYNQLKK